MPDKDASTPRVFLIRHGETEWTLSGRFTGTTDIPLTAHGIAQVQSTARLLVGPGKLLSPRRIAQVFISPRTRAQRTAALLFGTGGSGLAPAAFETTPALAEWDYGAYEGLLAGEIRAGRRARGLDPDGGDGWDIWRDGCEGGESPAAVAARLDALVARIRALHRPAMVHGAAAADVVLVSAPRARRLLARGAS
ncbi:hypothetical protein MMC18_009147 [Xylographa bjoerkii]|nr:hypothetical protein [Xylographa bjoerkii]